MVMPGILLAQGRRGMCQPICEPFPIVEKAGGERRLESIPVTFGPEDDRDERFCTRTIPSFSQSGPSRADLGCRYPQSMADPSERNYYELLDVPRTASPAEIKASYHRLLLSHHPDKSDPFKHHPARMDVDIGRLKDAFITLFSPESRIKYDSELSSRPDLSESSRSRPAHIVSLEDFKDLGQFWTFNCRCGGQYTIGEEDMEKGVHLIACSSCSEVIWVGYEACPSEDDSTNSSGPQP